MGAFVELWLSGPGLLMIVAGVAAWAFARPHSPAPRRTLLAVSLLYLLASIYAVPYAASRLLLTRGLQPLQAASLPSAPRVVVILGGGASTVHDGDRHIGILNQESAARTLAGYRAYVATKADWVVSSAGVVNGEPGDESSGALIHEAIVRLGVPPEKILVEADSRDTRDEAVIIAPMLRRLGAREVVLVTSDIHMLRAMAAFRGAGWPTVPAIAPDPRRPRTLRGWIMPTSHGLEYTERVAHELLGLLYYTARGWATF